MPLKTLTQWSRPSQWLFIWKFLVPSLLSMALIAALALAAALALQNQTRRMHDVVAGALENALFLGEVRAELRGDARDLYSTLAARAGGDAIAGSAANAAKISVRLKALQDKVKARAAKADSVADRKAYEKLIQEIDSQKGTIEFVASMLEIDLNAAISFVGQYGVSEHNTDTIVQDVLNRTDARAKDLARQSVDAAQHEVILISFIAVIAALGAGGLGLYIGLTTSRSIRTIADATRRLAQGDMSVDAKSLQRSDELGQVVTALEVFKDVTLQSQALSEEQAMAAEARSERASIMERLVDDFNRDFAGLIRGVEKASSHLGQSAEILSTTAGDNTHRAACAVTSIVNVCDSMTTVSDASDQLGVTILDVDRQAAASAEVARDAGERADHTQTAVLELSQAVVRINEIVDLISSVARQTNLLALNATIEAARAGEAGRGFAVVAHEVKGLADQTSKATEEIRARIGDVRTAAERTTHEISAIGEVIGQMQRIADDTSLSVRQQVQATREITHSLSNAVREANEASTTIDEMNRSARQAGDVSGAVTEASISLTRQADQMKDMVEGFLKRASAL